MKLQFTLLQNIQENNVLFFNNRYKMISIIERWKFQNGAKSFYKFVFILFISQFFIRLYELTYIAFSNPDFKFSIGNITSCFLFDVSFILFVSGVLLPIFILTNAYFPKTSKIGLFTLVGLFTLAGFLCSRFYATTLVPVGKVIFLTQFPIK